MDARLILPALRGRPVRRPTMNRGKSNLIERHTFPELLDFSTVKKSREWRGRRAARRLGERPDTRDGAFNGFHCGRDVFSRRPGSHSFAGGEAKLGQIGAVRKNATKQGIKGAHISTRIYKGRIDGGDQVTSGSYAVASDHRATTQYSFVYDDSERVVLRRQHHHIGGCIERRQLRLIDKSQKAHPVGNAKTHRLSLQFFLERAIACEQKQRIRDSSLGKRLEEVQGTCAGLKFGTK